MEEESSYIVSNRIKSEIVEEIGKINFQGNIIPAEWYKYIKFPSGKADLLGITILSEIVYWYRPTEIRDEKTGKVLDYKKKFKADKLQRTYFSFAQQFGVTKRQVTSAIKRLERLGLITTELRNITTTEGIKMNNLLYLEPIPSKVLDITHRCETYDIQTSYPPHLKVTPIPSKCETNTDITTKVTTEITTIYDHWLNQNIYKHNRNTFKSQIRTALKKYSEDEILTSITNYGVIVNGEEYYWSYKWTLGDFLKRGIDKFMDLDIAKENFKNNGKKDKSNKSYGFSGLKKGGKNNEGDKYKHLEETY